MSTNEPNQAEETAIDETFPFSSYRPYQREILQEAADILFGADSEYDTVVIYAPTGIGKSPINVALAKLAESAFYTTPQKKRRDRLDGSTLCTVDRRPTPTGVGSSGIPERRSARYIDLGAATPSNQRAFATV